MHARRRALAGDEAGAAAAPYSAQARAKPAAVRRQVSDQLFGAPASSPSAPRGGYATPTSTALELLSFTACLSARCTQPEKMQKGVVTAPSQEALGDQKSVRDNGVLFRVSREGAKYKKAKAPRRWQRQKKKARPEPGIEPGTSPNVELGGELPKGESYH